VAAAGCIVPIDFFTFHSTGSAEPIGHVADGYVAHCRARVATSSTQQDEARSSGNERAESLHNAGEAAAESLHQDVQTKAQIARQQVTPHEDPLAVLDGNQNGQMKKRETCRADPLRSQPRNLINLPNTQLFLAAFVCRSFTSTSAAATSN